MSPKGKATSEISLARPKLGNRPIEPYVYEALVPGEIRILLLSPGQENEPLRATLEVVVMADRPRYKAISYTWGDPIFSHSIELPGGTMQITKSLSDTLKCFRKESEAVRLWADAVCIDQKSIEEKNHQVASMHQVYEEAEEVLIWLGGARPSDCLVSFLLKSMAMLPEATYNLPDRPVSEEVMAIHDEILMSSTEKPVRRVCEHCDTLFSVEGSHISRDALNDFAARAWFWRLWVIQEAWCAAHFTMYFGHHRVSSSVITSALRGFGSFTGFGFSQDLQTYINFGQRLFEVTPLRNIVFSTLFSNSRSKNSTAHTLFFSIMNTRHAALTIPHDRVFAVSRLANVHNSNDLQPDYGLTIKELHARAAVVELTGLSTWTVEPNLNTTSPFLVLSLAGVQRRWNKMNAASWVPNIDNLTEECARKGSFHVQRSRKAWAGGRSQINVVKGNSPYSIQVRGTISDHIESVCESTQIPPYDRQPSNNDMKADDNTRWEGTAIPWFKKCIDFVLSSQRSVALDGQSLTNLMFHKD